MKRTPSAIRRGPFEFGDVAPPMVGFVPRQRPVITVQSYDPARRSVIEMCDRDQLIAGIAAHLRCRAANFIGMSLREMYGSALRRSAKPAEITRSDEIAASQFAPAVRELVAGPIRPVSVLVPVRRAIV